MLRTRPTFVVSCLLLCLLATLAPAQHGGSRAGREFESGVSGLPMLAREEVESYITIDGRAELRVPPTAVRVVLAVTGEAESAQECQKLVETTASRVTAAWTKLGVAPENIHADFIAILPRYEFEIERRGDIEVGLEKKVGYRMQSNLHLAVESEARAEEALNSAFAEGVTDIIAFDYANDDLDAHKTKARAQAIEAAKAKADMLLALLPDRPAVINLQERTEVRYPQSMYESFERTYEESVTQAYRRDIPFVRAFRPQNTYYRGLDSDSDIQPAALPMRPEISVVSTVRLYFASPAALKAKENENAKD
ncbi:MAG: SIMPL domain-containing protein [Pirellulaceae bacterium]